MPNYYIHDLNPIAINYGSVVIPWYWLIYLLSFFYIFWLGPKLFCRNLSNPITPKDWSDYLCFSWIGMLLGARLGYFCIYQPGLLLSQPFEVFRIWAGGMSFHGGLLGVFCTIVMIAKLKNQSPWRILDIFATLIPLCIGAGRVANFINGELAGRVTDVPWAVVFPTLFDYLPRHPSQLYEALGEGLILGGLMWRSRSQLANLSHQTALFAIYYGTLRFFLEFFREPDPQLGLLLFNLSMGQLLSLILLLFGLYLLFSRSPISYNQGSGQFIKNQGKQSL
jgi:phosphatidylglycerol:prolipoprotein diacylglycerol transferase